ncbi:MAG TPA: glutaredoxin [Candidatus Omnitrophota bacterium]|nr:glutaredoxin [Candidatus Omnitrophota bacterium]HPB67552.1 glutaredoxin [Candidatus Omnitrophota bacterium]HQO59047.1 glutaredoxin [Candidatus Omnitrophota bacterium]
MNERLLYYKSTCPYCQKVLNFIDEQGIELPLKNIDQNAEYRKELLNIGGKSQVPCLFVNGQVLYDTDQIVDWLKQNYS